MRLVHQIFVLLARCASFDVVSDPFVHVRPPVRPLYCLDCLVSSWVSGGGGVMIVAHDFPSCLVRRRDYDLVSFEPLGLSGVVVGEGVINVVGRFPFFHFSLLLVLRSSYFRH